MKKNRIAILAALVAAAFSVTVNAQDAKSPWPADAKVYIISPKSGETVSGPVTVLFGLKGLGVAPAGVEKAKTGHHHLLIDTKIPAELNETLIADKNHVHFGGGQTQATIELTPGQHTLQLLMGDHNHVPYNPPLASEVVTITVK
ncbi:MAG: DUF4399 domain-containing protein [Hyphomicrobiales bacterium]|nr:DUF4399 domain-containing protein [Hyphomicrobiales bacterium]